MPSELEKPQEGMSILLGERINAGLQGSKQTFVAACSLNRDGEKVGKAGDYRYSVDPSNLVAAAYYEFASLVVTKRRFRYCAGCGHYFVAHHGNRIYCDERCWERTRKRKQRARK
jgi:ribosomal protein S27AE